MDKVKEKKSLISKTLQRCRSLGSRRTLSVKPKVAPEGCVSVCVGADGERFFVRTECLNHPLFRELLDDAEMEYGYAKEGPLRLPCNVELFRQVVWEMEQEMVTSSPRCSFVGSYSSYQLLSPSRPMTVGRY